jgi:hypothetical protein
MRKADKRQSSKMQLVQIKKRGQKVKDLVERHFEKKQKKESGGSLVPSKKNTNNDGSMLSINKEFSFNLVLESAQIQ